MKRVAGKMIEHLNRADVSKSIGGNDAKVFIFQSRYSGGIELLVTTEKKLLLCFYRFSS